MEPNRPLRIGHADALDALVSRFVEQSWSGSLTDSYPFGESLVRFLSADDATDRMQDTASAGRPRESDRPNVRRVGKNSTDRRHSSRRRERADRRSRRQM